MTSVPLAPQLAESTTTVVIGSGFSGLAVASELSRQGVASIVVDGLELMGAALPLRRVGLAEPGALSERGEILRLLWHYAETHHVDVRRSTHALELRMAAPHLPGALPLPKKWIIRTAEGLLLADNVVFTRCGQNQLRRILASLGIKIGRDVPNAMRALGLYLVGVGDLISPTTREILHQAKAVSNAISATISAADIPELTVLA
ncbi:FAD-binding protein [Paenarthrobacter sp. Z7-10]|uniref:FAD-binding protein n=1 Tax=Paenarthrobacter sp. Z7-10 TaxID=2787635 RepID=UPI0022A91F30|nr:FAD-binding protein [Paenarthrobacter sp. Z7-10]MCZ2403353.1 FAD-binding protein [Paenarthrobacter sp. Z7-10]